MTHNNWPTVKLGNLITRAKSQTAGSKEYPVLSMTMEHGMVLQKERFKKRIAGKNTEKYKVVENGQLVVGFPIDEGVLDFQTLVQAGIVSPAYKIWELKDSSVCNLNYLRRYLRSNIAISYYRARLQGTTARRRSLTDQAFLQLPVPFPPLEEQRRIARVLGNCSKLHDQISGRKNLLESLFRSTTTSIFGNYSSTRKLEDFATVKTGPFGSMIHQSDYVSPGVPLINPQHIVNNKLSPSAEHQISSAKALTLEQYILRPGDIILGRRGQMGRAALVAMSDCPVICGTGCLIVRPHRIEDSVWLWAYLTGPLATQLLERAAIGATLPNLNSKIVSQLKVPSINSDLKSQIDQLHRTASRLLEKIDKSSVLTTELQASLYARAFNGKL